jgi:chlorobactene glucosyltransferase
MVDYLTHNLVRTLIIFQALILLVILSNVRLLHQARRYSPPPAFPKVTILVPARNEENNIAGCIRSLLVQDYPAFEILVLDDQSSDDTRIILEQIASLHPSLRVLVGKTPPDGLLGKNWACVQLVQQAQGDLLFFTDADTLHHPQTIRASVTALLGTQADMVTGFPRQRVHSWGEKLLVPFFSWAILSFIPLELAYRLRLPGLSCAVGQMMLFRREAYETIGGHERLGLSIVDDLMLARRIKAAGLRWRVVFIADLITCRMYQNSREALCGLEKNLFAAFGFRLLPYLFVFLWLAVMFWEPLIVLGLWFFGQAPQARAYELASCIGMSLFVWLVPYFELGIPFQLAFMYPITLLANEVVAIKSLRLSLAGRLAWKGRPLTQYRWRWL